MGSALSVKNYESPADRRLAGGFLADTNYSETPVPIDSSRERDRKGFLYLSVTCQPMGRANNERQCCSSKAQHIFHSVADIM